MRKVTAIYSEAELVKLLQQGKEWSFEELFVRFHSKVYHYLFMITKRREVAEELVQDTFIKLWEYREQIDTAYPFDALLFTIAKNTALNHLRNGKRLKEKIEEYGRSIEVLSNATENSVVFNDYMRISEDAINKLSPQRKSIFKMSRFEGKSYEEIASVLGISKNTVRLQMVKSLKLIRSFLRTHDIQSKSLSLLALIQSIF